MRFKVKMVNHFGEHYDETIIANNENEAKRNARQTNPNSNILNAKWVYK